MHVPQDDTKLGGVVDGQTTVLPFRGIWTHWRNGQRCASWSPRKRNTKSFSWEEITPVQAPVHTGGWLSWNQLGREGPECPDGQVDNKPLQSRRLIIPHCSDLGRHIWILDSGCCVGLPGTREHMDILEWLQQRATRVIKGLGCIKKGWEFGLFKEGSDTDIPTFKHSWWRRVKESESLYSGALSDRTRSNMHKLKHRKFHPNTQNYFYTVRVMEHCNSLPRELVESPLLEIIKNPTGHGPEQPSLIYTLSEQGLDWTNSRGAHQPQPCWGSMKLESKYCPACALTWREHPEFPFKIIQNHSKLSDVNEA